MEWRSNGTERGEKEAPIRDMGVRSEAQGRVWDARQRRPYQEWFF